MATFRLAENLGLSSHNRLIWTLRESEDWTRLENEYWPPSEDWSQLSDDDKASLWQQFYGNDWPDFESGKQIPPEGENLQEYYRMMNTLNDRIAVESSVTGNRYSIPDIREIPWAFREVLKLKQSVDRWKDARDRIKQPKTDDMEGLAVYSEKADKLEKDWQNILHTANGLDRYFKTTGRR